MTRVKIVVKLRSYDTKSNGPQQNDTPHKNTQHYGLNCNCNHTVNCSFAPMLSVVVVIMLIIIMLCAVAPKHLAYLQSAE